MELQLFVLFTMSKPSCTSENYNPTLHQSVHHLKPQSEQRDIHPRFQKFPNHLQTPKTIKRSNTSSSKINWVSYL